MKKGISLFFICSIIIVLILYGTKNYFVGQDNMKKTNENEPVQKVSDITSAEISDTSTEVSNKELEEIKFILGKWEILEPTGYGYIYSDQYLESDIIGGIITIQEKYIDANLPYKKARLENPKYKIEKQNKDEFVSWTRGNFKSFGFEKETDINFVRIYGNSNEDDCEPPDGSWCVTGGTFWIRDKEHLIVTGPGPIYYLAQKVD